MKTYKTTIWVLEISQLLKQNFQGGQEGGVRVWLFSGTATFAQLGGIDFYIFDGFSCHLPAPALLRSLM